ncbi:MAG: T9SS type A sorting domain-containing protein [Calditrichia bacterium]
MNSIFAKQFSNSILILVLTFISTVYTQVDILWTKKFGGIGTDRGFSIKETVDNGFIITGTTSSFDAGNQDVWLIKTNAFGDTLWTKTFGGTNYDAGESIQQTLDGGYIIAGITSSFGAGSKDVWLIKTDAFGDTLWTKTFGGTNYDRGNAVQQTSDGGYIITGGTSSFGTSNQDVWLIKTNTSGDTLWTKTFGRVGYNGGYSVQQTLDDGYILVGYKSPYPVSYSDIWLIKTNTYGDTLWTKTFGGSEEDMGFSVQQTTDGGYVIVGHTVSFGNGNSDIWLIKTNASGDTLWTKTFGGFYDDQARSVQQTTDNGYIITGRTSSFGIWDIWLIKTNTNGDIIWTKTFDGTGYDEGYSVQQTTDGDYIVVGETDSVYNRNVDLWVIKTTSMPNKIKQNYYTNILDFTLYQNYPNPFNPVTTINYILKNSSYVKLSVFDITGREVKILVNKYQSGGEYSVLFKPSNLASGIYIYKLRIGPFEQTRKMMLLR